MINALPYLATCVALGIVSIGLAALPGEAAARKSLEEIVSPDARIEKVAGDFRFTEGPVWDGDNLLFSDIPADTIWKYTPGTLRPLVFRQPSGQANGNTLDPQGRLVTGEHKNRRVSRTEKDGRVVTLAERYDGKRLNSPNDVVVRSDGSTYFTDPPYGLPNGTEGKELEFNGVYLISPQGRLTLLVRDFVRPNGLALSPDEKLLYVNDSQEGHIRVFEVQEDGTLAKGRLFAELKAPGKDGVPDGMKVDIRGNVYCTGPQGVWVFTPRGELLGKIIPPEVPANVGWGDADYKTLYMTARTGLYRIRCNIAGVRPGGLR